METTKQTIKCPECSTIQVAEVEHMIPFDTYIHHCEKCGYVIMESDWLVVKPLVRNSHRDTCSNCGSEYDDILGIGKCGKCFYGR